MDERHWWFASKLQETFHFSGYDNPSLLEDFLSDFDVAELISKFLGPGDPSKLFFYCEEDTDEENRSHSATNRRLRVVSQVNHELLTLGRDKVCLYVLRRDPRKEVDVSMIDRDVYCGEIRHSVLPSLAILLSEAYTPLLHTQTDWGLCSKENVASFLQAFDRLSSSIQEAAVQSLSHQVILQQPSLMLKSAFAQLQPQHGGRVVIGAETVSECESLMNDWIASIESSLIEATDERYRERRKTSSICYFLFAF